MRKFQIADWEKGFNTEVVVLDKGEEIGDHKHMGNIERLEVLSGVIIVETEHDRAFLHPGGDYKIAVAVAHKLKVLGGRSIFLRGFK